MYMNKSVLYLYLNIQCELRLRCGFCRIEVYTVWDGIRNYEMLSVESGTVIVFIREDNSLLLLLFCVFYVLILAPFSFFSKQGINLQKRWGQVLTERLNRFHVWILFCSFRWHLKRCSLYVLVETLWNCSRCKILWQRLCAVWDHAFVERRKSRSSSFRYFLLSLCWLVYQCVLLPLQ